MAVMCQGSFPNFHASVVGRCCRAQEIPSLVGMRQLPLKGFRTNKLSCFCNFKFDILLK